jgi:hypothetical protein
VIFGSAAVFWLIVGLELDCCFVQSKFKQLAGVFRDDVIGFGETDSAGAAGHRISSPSHSRPYPQQGGLRATIYTYILLKEGAAFFHRLVCLRGCVFKVALSWFRVRVLMDCVAFAMLHSMLQLASHKCAQQHLSLLRFPRM